MKEKHSAETSAISQPVPTPALLHPTTAHRPLGTSVEPGNGECIMCWNKCSDIGALVSFILFRGKTFLQTYAVPPYGCGCDTDPVSAEGRHTIGNKPARKAGLHRAP